MSGMSAGVGGRFEKLVEIMRALRAPDGCPWDREQTHASLRPFLLEETYEALEAIDSGSPMHLCEELGDVLFEVVFMSRISERPATSRSPTRSTPSATSLCVVIRTCSPGRPAIRRSRAAR
jgi:NTP pyrophosphatase (non-canonical NTP hydrolase)